MAPRIIQLAPGAPFFPPIPAVRTVPYDFVTYDSPANFTTYNAGDTWYQRVPTPVPNSSTPGYGAGAYGSAPYGR